MILPGFFIEIDFDVPLDLREDVHRHERSMPPGVGVEGRNTHEAMHARLRLQEPVRIVAFEPNGRALNASYITGHVLAVEGNRMYAFKVVQTNACMPDDPETGWTAQEIRQRWSEICGNK